MDFDAAPHYAVYGAPLSGKTTLLHTLITGLAMTFSPAEAEMILLDFGGGSLSRFEALPHVSALIREGEPEQMERFKERMTAEMQKRKICFRKEKVANYAQYVQKKQNLPAVLVIIDNEIRLTAFADDIAPFLIELSMSGSDCGIHLVFTSNNPNKTGMNLQANIGGNIALHMADRNDYRGGGGGHSFGSSNTGGLHFPGNGGFTQIAAKIGKAAVEKTRNFGNTVSFSDLRSQLGTGFRNQK